MAKDSRKIALTITANTTQLRSDMRRASAELRGFEQQVTTTGAKLRAMRMRLEQSGILGRGGGALKTAAGFAGVFGVSQMLQGAKESDAALTDIAITGNLTDKQLQKLRRTLYEVSNATAKSTGELASFVATVTTMTGDAEGASAALADIGEVMVATGASGEALAGVYVKLTTTMGLLPKQTREAFNVLRSQEKLGSITMANIAAHFGKVLASGGVFGAEGKGMKGIRTMGGLYQIAQRGFAVGQEGEAATSASSFLRFLGQRAKVIKKEFGVEVFNKAGVARDLPTVLEELGTAFNTKGETLRTKGALIFGRAGIRTAMQLKDAMAGGAGSKVGTFASFNELVRTAGGSDVIGSDAARRRQSAAYQYDAQLNILSNTLKKHMTPIFGQLASSLKEFGPDLVKVVKFLLENSRGLLTLWLGYKGVTFFKNLMAPVGGGVAGAGAAGGMVMGPGGQMMMAPTSPVAQQSRWATMARYGMTGGGMALGAASSLGLGGGVLSGPSMVGDMAGNMALMSGNPYLMAAGAFQKASNASGNMFGSSIMGDAPKTHLWGLIQERQSKGPQRWGVLDNVAASANKLAEMFEKVARDTPKTIEAYYKGSWQGFDEAKRQDELLKKYHFGETIESGRGHYDKATGEWVQTVDAGTWGMTAQSKIKMAKDLGEKGLQTLHGRVSGEAARARAVVVRAMRASGMADQDITEESIGRQQGSERYTKLKDFADTINRLIMVFKNGWNVNVHTVSGGTPAERLSYNNAGPVDPAQEEASAMGYRL